MGFLSVLALVMLTLVGYSAGATATGRGKQLSPTLIDLVVVPGLWIAALLSRGELGHWLSIFVWLVVAGLVSAGLTAVRRPHLATSRRSAATEAKPPDANVLRTTWARWKAFAAELGHYQGRLLIAFFYFVIVTPFGLPFRLFNDPLGARSAPQQSGWLARPGPDTSIEEARNQF
jgi:hypothetical protein